MTTPEIQSNNKSWFKNNIVFIVLLIIIFIFVYVKISDFESIISESIVLPKTTLDFQNKSGAARIKSTFTDILISSGGSKKKGNGYQLMLEIINPSSISLRSVTCKFRHSYSDKTAIYQNVNMVIGPGRSKKVTCFVSDLSDTDLRFVEVSVAFDQISFY